MEDVEDVDVEDATGSAPAAASVADAADWRLASPEVMTMDPSSETILLFPPEEEEEEDKLDDVDVDVVVVELLLLFILFLLLLILLLLLLPSSSLVATGVYPALWRYPTAVESSFRVNGCCSLLLAPLLFALLPLLVLLPGADVASFCQSLTRPRTEFMLWGDGEGPGKTEMKKPLAFEFGKFEFSNRHSSLPPPHIQWF